MNNILYHNPNEVAGLISNTYILSAVAAIVFLLITMIISKTIAYEGGKNPQDPKRRRIWFWVIGIVATVAFFCYNFFVVKNQIVSNPMLLDEFAKHMAIATGLTFLIYLVAGYILSHFVFKSGKFGTIFPSK